MKDATFIETGRFSDGSLAGFMPRESAVKSILKSYEQSERNMVKCVERFELMGTDGKWHGWAGFPIGVQSTGEKRPYWVSMSPHEGTAFGTRFNSKQEWQAAFELRLKKRLDEFESQLNQMDVRQIQSQFDYWSKI